MAATRIGIPLPAQTNTRPDGRYRMSAPDAPVGGILRVRTRDGATLFVEVVCPHGKRLFVSADGELVEFSDWDYATRLEVKIFRLKRRVEIYADEVELHGAPAFVAAVRGLPDPERSLLLAAVAAELETRGKDGKASQVRAFGEQP